MLKNPTKRDFFYVTVFYLAPAFFWAVMLMVVLQKRIEAFVPVSTLPRSMNIIIGAGGLVSVLTQILVGAISDRHGGKRGRRTPYIIAGSLLAVPAIWMFALAGNFPMLVVSFMLLQLFINLAQGPYQALLPDMIPPERHGIASGYMGLWQLIGQGGGFALLLILFLGVLGGLGLTLIFAVISILFVGLMIATVVNVREEPYTGERIRKRYAVLAILKTDLKGNPSFVWALISRLLVNLGFYIAVLYIKWYLQFALGLTERNASLYTAIFGLVVTVAGLIGTLPAGRLADIMSKKTVIYGCCGLCIISSALFWSARDVPWALAAAAVFGLGLGAYAAVDWALACNVLPAGDAAKFFGIWSVSSLIPQMAAAGAGHLTISALTGPLGQAGAYRAVFASIIPFMILGTLAVSRVREKPVRRPAAKPAGKEKEMTQETVRSRFQKVLAGEKPADRLPVVEWAGWWDLTVQRWREEGLPAELDVTGIRRYFGLDINHQIWFPDVLVSPTLTTQRHMENESDYEALLPTLYPDPVPYDRDAWQLCAAEQKAGDACVWVTVSGFFWWPRVLFGIEAHLLAFYDQPGLMHRINRDMAQYHLRCIDDFCSNVCVPDFMTFGEDMSYNHGPMISKEMFDEFMAPYYRQVVPRLKEYGIVPLIDSDGDIEPLIPWFQEVGLEGILPLERMAGVDVNRIRANHPDWKMMGGFDKTVMHLGEEAIRQEFERILPTMRSGGYIPSVDHQTPPAVSIEDYRLYLRLLREYAAKAVRQ